MNGRRFDNFILDGFVLDGFVLDGFVSFLDTFPGNRTEADEIVLGLNRAHFVAENYFNRVKSSCAV